MNRKYFLALILMFFMTGIISNSVFSQDDAMKKKAVHDMKEWSKGFAPDQFKQLGYIDKVEFDKAELGVPYVVYTIDPNQLLEYEPDKDFSSLLTKTEYIVYPVISEGKNKSLLWMYQKENEWKMARIGSAGLAENLKTNEDVIQKRREEFKLKAGEVPQLVRIYQLYLDFYYVKGEEDEFIIPMQTIPDLNIRGNTFYPMKEILPVLQENLRQKMPFKDKDGMIKEY